jgi:cytochrome P450
LGKYIGQGLLTSDGEYWLKQRRAIQPGFHRKRLQGISYIMMDEINAFIRDRLDPLAESGETFDMSKLMTELAFRVVSKSLFGGAVGMEELERIDAAVSATQQQVVTEVRQPYLLPWMWLNGTQQRNRRLIEETDEIILENIRHRQTSGERHDDLLDMLIETRYEDGSGMTEQQLRDEAVILYVAGHETSAVALAWAWALIAQHPEVERQLLESVTKTLGGEDPSFEKLRELGYTLQVIEETMRLYPPAWITDREALEDDDTGLGVTFKKGRDVIVFIYGLHNNPKYWDEPEAFRPERFTPENKKKHTPYAYLPFGGGPRLCIGNNFALMEMQFVLAQMIRRYRFELLPNQRIELNPMITLRPRYGVQMRIHKRN